ncbi:MAG: FAD-dependent oxidoreductase [Bacteroidales bacterium]|nr:FAD-dependent oxidoreductase [Bacteroidales bacterium]
MAEEVKHVVVIGGGVAGMECAGRLGHLGYRVTLLEKDKSVGGHLPGWYQLFPDRRDSQEVSDYLNDLVGEAAVDVVTGLEVESVKPDGKSYIVRAAGSKSYPADAVVVATGFDLFDATRKEEYGYGIYENVITSADLEKMFHKGEIVTTKGVAPRRIGLIHCVGSRDEKVGNFHCSKVCCVTAVKQAIEIREKLPQTQVFCFYMDMRMFGPFYEELYRESQERWNVNYIRGKVSEASENIEGRIVIKVEDTLAGRPLRMELDMLVLMSGMEMSASGSVLAEKSGLETGSNGFLKVRDHHSGTNGSSHAGIFFAGTCIAPMNITDSLSHARAAVLEVSEYLSKS